MKVLMLSKACYVAAYRRKLEELASLPGVDLTLIVPPYWRMGKKKDPLEHGYQEGYRMIVKNPVFNGYHHLHFYRNLGDILFDLKPDVFHIDEEPYDLVTFSALRAARKAKVRTLFFTWQNIDRAFPFPFGFFERYTLRNADAAIAGNRAAADILRRKGFSGPLEVIPQFGVDPEIFRPVDREERGNLAPFKIGFVGRIVEEKGLAVLLEAVARLKGDWHLQLIGSGPFEAAVRQKAADLGIDQRLSYVAWMPSTEIPAFLPKLDVLVVPSLTLSHWKEQFGRVLVEAMACGVPVVGSNSGEIPNVIGEAGLICREGDSQDLRAKLENLMDDRALARRLSLAGRRRVLERFTQRKVAENTFALYGQTVRLHAVV